MALSPYYRLCFFFSRVHGCGQNYIVGQTPLANNTVAFVHLIWEQQIPLVLSLDDDFTDGNDIPCWFPKGRPGLKIRYKHIS